MKTLLKSFFVGSIASSSYIVATDKNIRNTIKEAPAIIKNVFETNREVYKLRDNKLPKKISYPGEEFIPRKNLLLIDSTLLGKKITTANGGLKIVSEPSIDLLTEYVKNSYENRNKIEEDFEIVVIYRTDKKNIYDKDRILPRNIIEKLTLNIFGPDVIPQHKVFIKGLSFVKKLNNIEKNSKNVEEKHRQKDKIIVSYFYDSGNKANNNNKSLNEEIIDTENVFMRTFMVDTSEKYALRVVVNYLINNSFKNSKSLGGLFSQEILNNMYLPYIKMQAVNDIKMSLNRIKMEDLFEVNELDNEKKLWNEVLYIQNLLIKTKVKNVVDSMKTVVLTDII